MKVSIVIPLHNKAKTIWRTLESIRNQSFQDYEVLVVDDGSTDGGVEVINNFEGIDMLTVISQSNKGPGAARNRGAAAAAGELLAFLDADDEWLPSYLECSVSNLEDNPGCAATVSGYFEYPSGLTKEHWWKQRGVESGVCRFTKSMSIKSCLAYLDYMSSWSTVVRKTAFTKWNGFYERDRCLYAEDSYLWLKLLLNEYIYISFEPLVKFHRENSDLSAICDYARPVEPFLNFPDEILDVTPPELESVAVTILLSRAAKTACVLGYWGNWREAGCLLKRFISFRLLVVPYGIAALVCSTPLGTMLGKCDRRFTISSRKV